MKGSVFAVTVYEGMNWKNFTILGINSLKQLDCFTETMLKHFDKVELRPVSLVAKKLFKTRYVGSDEWMCITAHLKEPYLSAEPLNIEK